MIRFAFTIFLFLTVIGCQTAVQRPKPASLVHTSRQTPLQQAKRFWNKTTQFLNLQKSEAGRLRADSDNAGSEGFFVAYRGDADVLPVNHSSLSLYKAGSIFSPLATTLESGEAELDVQQIATEITKPKTEEPVVPKSLSKRSAAPTPDEELLADATPSKKIKQDIDLEYTEENFYDEPRPLIKRTLPKRDEPAIAQSPIPSASNPLSTLHTSAPPVSSPQYPSLMQLPSTGTMQASYQQSMPSYAQNAAGSHNTSYPGTGYGAGDWQTPTRQAVEQLRYAIEQTPSGKTLSNEMRLRMLEMLLGNKAEAAKPIPAAEKPVNDFMGRQVLGLAALLDDTAPEGRSKYVSAAYQLNEGLLYLQNLCPMKLKTVTFVKDWFGYGQYETVLNEFRSGNDFVVYTEIENPTARPNGDGFEVHVAISYEIRDIQANTIVRVSAGKPSETALSRKRDYCLAINGTLPTTLAPGDYYLRISMTDLNDASGHYAEEQIPFRITGTLAEE